MKEKTKILIVSECFYPEEFKINDIAFQWVNDGYEVDVLTLIPTYPKAQVLPGYKNKIFLKENIKGVNVFRLNAVVNYNHSRLKKILKYLNFMILGSIVACYIGRRYDKVFGYNLGALTDMLPAVLIRKIYKKPLTLWVQDLWPESVYAYGFKNTRSLSFILNYFVKFIYRNVDNIAISSNGFKVKLANYFVIDTFFHYLPNWADTLNDSLEPVILNHDKKVHFTFAGNIGKVQNLENIINAFSLLPEDYLKKSQLNIIGDGSNLDLLKSITKKEIPITFHGKINRNLMSKYYKASDFLIISLIDKPIFSLTVPAKLQTYIAAKKPILAIINGETADIVNHYKLGLCSKPGDISSIIKLFKDCIVMPAKQKESFINDKNLFDKQSTIKGLSNLVVGSE